MTYVSLFGHKGLDCFSDLEDVWDDLPVSRLKYNALDDFHEVFQTTSRRSSGLPGNRLTEFFSHVSPFYNKSEHFDMETEGKEREMKDREDGDKT
ncbi:hypothetical protein YC2023_072504 [Brassica napus]